MQLRDQRPAVGDPRRAAAARARPPRCRGLWSAAAIWIKEGPGVGKTRGRADGPRRLRDRRLRVQHRARLPAPEDPGARPGAGRRGLQQDVRDRPSRRAVGVRPRRQRLSPFYEREQELGAVVLSRRPAGSARSGTSRTRRCSRSSAIASPAREAEWDARWWSPIINAEHLAMRDRAAIIDLTAFCDLRRHRPGRARRRPAHGDAPDGRGRRPRRLHAGPAARAAASRPT